MQSAAIPSTDRAGNRCRSFWTRTFSCGQQPHHPHSLIAEQALTRLRNQNETLTITAQNLVEFWAVVTRPVGENGLGYTVQQAADEIAVLRRLFFSLPEEPLFEKWKSLVEKHQVSGKNVHDARLVAAMSVHRVPRILTFNVQDFRRYTSIQALDPSAVAAE